MGESPKGSASDKDARSARSHAIVQRFSFLLELAERSLVACSGCEADGGGSCVAVHRIPVLQETIPDDVKILRCIDVCPNDRPNAESTT